MFRRRQRSRTGMRMGAFIAALAVLATLPGTALAAPANDDFANAKIIIGSLPYTDSTNPSGSTFQTGEPESPCDNTEDGTVWYRFTPTSGGVFSFDTIGSNYDTDISVYRGTTLNNIVFVDCNHDIDVHDPELNTSRLAFRATANTRYYLRIKGEGGTDLKVRVRKVSPPSNDNYGAARNITSLPFSTNADVTKATIEANVPQAGTCAVMRATRWYKYTPPTDQVVWVRTFGTVDHDTVLGLYSGSPIANANQIACNDDQWFQGEILYASGISFMAQAGTTYRIQVGGYDGESGARRETRLDVERVVQEVNDDFNDRTVVGSLGYHDPVNTRRATRESGEPTGTCFTSAFNTAWYEYTASSTDPISAQFDGGGEYEPGVAIYRVNGPGFGGLEEVACTTENDVEFTPVDGNTYVFQVAASGTIALPGEFLLEFAIP